MKKKLNMLLVKWFFKDKSQSLNDKTPNDFRIQKVK